ncbi:hypothetical protein L202_07316 [Cryptococcus amylolentus CBS 6039]|uniref:Uncharacterized protein n=1 Tax=Cryptococcus amylolentus CBS 6039 TaxID=1295533 RepID=A0A1E3HBS8_9TREE|nr:hypothetical protein L202_07316 [Cryptococcus amylolentus CBS 6039]ODN73787.1 hypothetical protein L202_07316 [Cryptococcus amylolentus CBS 6039]
MIRHAYRPSLYRTPERRYGRSLYNPLEACQLHDTLLSCMSPSSIRLRGRSQRFRIPSSANCMTLFHAKSMPKMDTLGYNDTATSFPPPKSYLSSDWIRSRSVYKGAMSMS